MNQGQEECDQKISNVEVYKPLVMTSTNTSTNAGQMENTVSHLCCFQFMTTLINCDQMQVKWKRQTSTIYFCIVNKEMHEICY